MHLTAKKTLRALAILGILVVPATLTAQTYNESGGLVVMEMENTPSPLDLWASRTAPLTGFTGSGYLEFTGNSPTNGPARSPLEFKFKINTPGLYYLHLHCARDTTHGQPSDHSNDCYVRVDGDYGAGPNAGNNHGDDAPLSMLKSDTKFFGGAADAFAWASGNRLDPGGHNNKRVAVYDFKAGQEYTLVVHGRSQWFSVNRIVFRHVGTATSAAQNLNTPESGTTGTAGTAGVSVTGELKKWHKVTLTFDGPSTGEGAATNPFMNYRLNVTFTNGGLTYVVPGYYAADGDAANTSASSGNKWRVHFAPPATGTWNYVASFRTGSNVAVAAGPTAGAATSFDGASGSFNVTATDKTGRDLRGKGRARYVGKHYLQFAETGEYLMKQGPDAPENFLAYEDFDGSFKSDGHDDHRIKSWSPHAGDHTAGDPTWGSPARGHEIIGAINYLASEGINVFSFLTMNIQGDDKNVFPYTSYTERFRMDVSRLDQWEIVLEHATRKGFFLHFKTQETENDQLLDGGALGNERKLYYRELIARFGHHLALNWNLGEENTNTDAQRKAFSDYIRGLDPYDHLIVVHTYPGQKNAIYTPLLGHPTFDGASLQGSNASFTDVHNDVRTWVTNSANAGRPWVVACDEPGDAQHALRPDNDAGSSHVDGRKNALWGTLMAGGAGNEWYFGYGHAHSDLTCEDFRSRNAWWDYCRYALEFFKNNGVPFWDMVNDNAKSSASNDYCFYKAGAAYVVYLKNGGSTNLDLSGAPGTFDVRWFDPRNGGALQNGSVTTVTGGGSVSLGNPPGAAGSDWTILVTLAGSTPTYALTVNSGSGDGTYAAGAVVTITANSPPGGEVFDQWTGNTGAVADVFSASTTVTMPASPITVTATYKSGGGGGGQSVAGFTLVNADTDADIGPLQDGDTLNLATLPTTNLNVRANTSPATVGSVRFGYDGNANHRTESAAPYALEGDTAGDYNPWTPSLGSHTLTATPYTASGGGGTAGTPLTVTFTVINQADQGTNVNLTAPAGGGTVSGTMAAAAIAHDPDVGATDGDGIQNVVFELRSGATVVATHTENVAPYTWNLDTTTVPDGAYTLRATATSTGAAGGTSAFDEIPLTVSNGGPLATHTLAWSVTGSGDVDRSPAGSNGATPSASGASDYSDGTTVTLTATPAAGFVFVDWSGPVADATSATTTVQLSADRTVTANFAAASLSVTPGADYAPAGPVGGPFTPPSMDYTLSNPGTSPVTWTAGTTRPWATLSATSGTLAGGASTTVTVSLTGLAGSLASGVYADLVTFTNTLNGAGDTTRSITLSVGGLTVIGPAPVFQPQGGEGGPFSPSTTTFTVANDGTGAIDWTVVADQPWVILSATGGTLAPAASVDVTVTLDPSVDMLPPGSYPATITFTNTTDGVGTTTQAASLVVLAPLVLAAAGVYEAGHCGATGLEFLPLALLFLAKRRRRS